MLPLRKSSTNPLTPRWHFELSGFSRKSILVDLNQARPEEGGSSDFVGAVEGTGGVGDDGDG